MPLVQKKFICQVYIVNIIHHFIGLVQKFFPLLKIHSKTLLLILKWLNSFKAQNPKLNLLLPL